MAKKNIKRNRSKRKILDNFSLHKKCAHIENERVFYLFSSVDCITLLCAYIFKHVYIHNNNELKKSEGNRKKYTES